ncbi:inositol monophosphatase family protein [Pediococcus ethanolidurans]|uniref:Fructose-1 6-bisphosphatase n=1 Tax=Pediococcus ethanolidurans TaxID=319653 RepID=A0A0R2JVR9_9LACO|nr:inositol monophosphatase family protein [Pediococcus ethanolidurans]KRN81199.1 fructose-1 6-bisphosphatase [Pediococcus ethanolidurans]GEN96055.1 fructose 1,6-bisphosphatase [Pediococcus ethanolidurans]SER95282.1 myo-inositol-1(or 4)-monophosphatase [Pediococcus ethanolidurans]
MNIIENLWQTDHIIRGWLKEVREDILSELHDPLAVAEKTSRKDLVTNVDKANEKKIIKAIRSFDSQAKILGEEGQGDQVTSMQGHVWIIDPLDGTLNFVKQRDNFAVMIALYIDGKGILGYIMDVMRNRIYGGGPSLGVFTQDNELTKPTNLHLRDGLLGVSGPMLIHDKYHLQAIDEASSGVRIIGSAGIEFIQVLKGKQNGYISHLMPWDFAAGKILAETLNLSVTKVDGTPVDMLSSNDVLVSTKDTQKDILNMIR